jgi:hypothetical protein
LANPVDVYTDLNKYADRDKIPYEEISGKHGLSNQSVAGHVTQAKGLIKHTIFSEAQGYRIIKSSRGLHDLSKA